MKASPLAQVAAQFFILSLIAFGGANAVVPEIHRQAVQVHHWMGDRDFAALFAIAQAAPGPPDRRGRSSPPWRCAAPRR